MPRTLVSVPPAFAAWLTPKQRRKIGVFSRAGAFVASDPEGTRLGSGGGTVALLWRAWQETSSGQAFEAWLRQSQTLVLHAGGEGRRLPAYAAAGKALLPAPSTVSGDYRRYDQTLADFQLPLYHSLLQESGPDVAVLVASGDVWLEFDAFATPRVSADIAGCGMQVPATVAQDFGVYFVRRQSHPVSSSEDELPISFFRQKPSPAEIRRHAAAHDFYVDSGLWLLSAMAIEFLFRRCGWNQDTQTFNTANGLPSFLDLYTEIGTAFGEGRGSKSLGRFGWSRLTTSVIPLRKSRFFHLGSTRQLLESYEALGSSDIQKPRSFLIATTDKSIAMSDPRPVWVDRASHTHWRLGGMNVVTGSAAGQSPLSLAPEQCIDIVPVRHGGFSVRPYHLDDRYRGGSSDGTICGQPAGEWLRRRRLGLSFDDVFDLPLYPVVKPPAIRQALVDWFFAAKPDPAITDFVLQSRRLSARDLASAVDFGRFFRDQRRQHALEIAAQLDAIGSGDEAAMSQDFAAIAELTKHDATLRARLRRAGISTFSSLSAPSLQSRGFMLMARTSGGIAAERYSSQAYARLQVGVLQRDAVQSKPRLALKEDQIVWGRSPVRLDLAGGWTDTPPYCLEHGGAVLNMAVLLNGQPPIQVFLRPLAEPVLSLKSIDLGVSQVVKTYEQLATFRDPRSGFSLPKAALAMAGFHPEFSPSRERTLQAQLARFGAGLEISLLSAVPKGSGLGTSSILAATILAAVNRACDLGWDTVALYTRTLAVEQLLTTGGGWQDQAGALFGGVKLIETAPGPTQLPTVRYLPTQLFEPPHANRTLLLYYTGITRLAKGILKEIVRDMFLGRFEILQTLDAIRANAVALAEAVQRNDRGAVDRAIARSWMLNKALDAGTTSPAIDGILARCGQELAGAKLLGAGGGGYMLFCARNAEAGERIREILERHPPNRRARFIDFEIAQKGLEVTVS